MNERDLVTYAKLLVDQGALSVNGLGMMANWDEDLLGRAVSAAAEEYHDHLPGLNHGGHSYSRLRFNRIKDVHTALLKAHDQAGDIAYRRSNHLNHPKAPDETETHVTDLVKFRNRR